MTETNLYPVWKEGLQEVTFPALKKDLNVDVAVVGGGITGITTAYLLAGEGKTVAVLESCKVGEGTTGQSTGNLYSLVDERLYHIRKHFDEDTMRNVCASRQAALDLIAQNIERLGISCHFKRTPWYLLAEDKEFADVISIELEAAKKSGLAAEKVTDISAGIQVHSAVKVSNQAQFNPLFYVKQLAQQAEKAGAMIFEGSAVSGQKKEDAFHKLTVGNYTVTAREVVSATHIPKGILPIQSMLGPYREHGIAFNLAGVDYPPPGIFWRSASGHHYSFRTYENDTKKYLIVVGSSHKVGQGSETEGFKDLRNYASARWKIEGEAYRWSGQHYHSADGLPYIGRYKDQIIATGFATDGLIYGTLAAQIITDLLMERKNTWAELYDPDRRTPPAGLKNVIRENINVAGQYLKDWPGGKKMEKIEDLENGEGGIFSHKDQKVAACKDREGRLHTVSAVCTHMQCIVNWNSEQQSWDCPCHGSRFKMTGQVIEGPAFAALEKINL